MQERERGGVEERREGGENQRRDLSGAVLDNSTKVRENIREPQLTIKASTVNSPLEWEDLGSSLQ